MVAAQSETGWPGVNRNWCIVDNLTQCRKWWPSGSVGLFSTFALLPLECVHLVLTFYNTSQGPTSVRASLW